MLKRLALQWISLLGWSSINEELRQNLLDVVSITPPSIIRIGGRLFRSMISKLSQVWYMDAS